jgi:hypothetical protein
MYNVANVTYFNFKGTVSGQPTVAFKHFDLIFAFVPSP